MAALAPSTPGRALEGDLDGCEEPVAAAPAATMSGPTMTPSRADRWPARPFPRVVVGGMAPAELPANECQAEVAGRTRPSELPRATIQERFRGRRRARGDDRSPAPETFSGGRPGRDRSLR